jgi:hypothetical protein
MSSNSIPSGYQSREFFYGYSRGGMLKTAIQDNHLTRLHTLWTKEHFYEGKSLSGCRILQSVIGYPLGMVGYLVDTAFKVVMLVGNFLALLISCLSCKPSWIRERAILLLDNLAAVGIGVVGVVIPPLAYRLDKIAEENMIKRWVPSYLKL